MLAPRIPRAVSKPARRSDSRRNRQHRDFVRSLPCVSCAASPRSQAAHIRCGTDGGTGLKPNDKWTVPLCHDCHQEQHRVGELAFFSERRIDSFRLAERLWRISGDEEQGRRAIERARMGR